MLGNPGSLTGALPVGVPYYRLGIADHDPAPVTALCPRVVVLHRGRRVAEGPPERVGANPGVLRAFAGRRARPRAWTPSSSAS